MRQRPVAGDGDCSRGTTATGAICPGARIAIPTGSGSRKSCCSRPASRAVLEHYRRFLQRFPTVQKLASAREPSVLAAWSGLGYYRRARMMHAAAKVIVKQHGGKFPGDDR